VIILAVFVLSWAKAVLVPLALAILFAFVLTPPVNWLRRWCGRAAAAVVVVLLVVVGLLTAGWGVTREIAAVANDLPAYRNNIRQKIRDLRGVEKNYPVEQVQRTLEDIQNQTGTAGNRQGGPSQPVIVAREQLAAWWGLPTWLSPLLGTLETLGLATILTIFVLIERQELRARLIRLLGDDGHLALTTRALDEAATRVSRLLLTQTAINATYGFLSGVGLWIIGVPYPLLWAVFAGLLRFVPYLGPPLGAIGPVALSLAALPGWIRPAEVVALFVGLELFTNLVLEVVLYAETAGVSATALLVAIMFWTGLWGAYGLLMATPLTICLVVFGRQIPGLEFLVQVMADEPVLAPARAYYQRLLASDQSEAWDLIEQHLAEHPRESVYDALMLPALNYTRRDRRADRLSLDEESAIVEATRDLLADLRRTTVAPAAAIPTRTPARTLRVLGCTVNDAVDETALQMLQLLVEDLPIAMEIRSGRTLSAEIVALVQEHDLRVICIADLPPHSSFKTRYLVSRLRAAVPDAHILVGLWAPLELAGEGEDAMREIGATHVATTLGETATQLRALVASVGSTYPTSEAAAGIRD
jgi:predicted PurR-regulated permease PerM